MENNKGRIFRKGNGQAGITLVALVVTVVVLLILAGVSIRLVLDNNGIITRAGDAKDKHEQGRINEQTDLDSAEEWINQMAGGNSGGGSLPTNADGSSKPYLPSSDYEQDKSTNLDTGLVIHDKDGNEYVWIEVPKTAIVYPTAGTVITEFTDDEYTAIETDLHTYTNDYRNGTSYKDEYYSDATTGLTSSQYSELKKKMLKSVYQNGGFWIGRYEAGIEENRTSDTAIITEDLVPTSKVNQYPLTYVNCSEAQTLASRVLPNGGTYTSSLMFGVQWDLLLKYLETKGILQEDLKTDSTSLGNYCNSSFRINRGKYAKIGAESNDWNEYNTTLENCVTYVDGVSTKISANHSYTQGCNGILLTTGASDECKKQNIYDFAGNVGEWTLEYTYELGVPCVFRGGFNYYRGWVTPASERWRYVSTFGNDDIGFRVALF